MLAHPAVSLCSFLAVAAIGFVAFLKWPTSYVPKEDQGYFMTSVQLPQGASLERTQNVMDKLTDMVMKLPEVENVMTISGYSFMGGGASSNMGSRVVVLKPWNQRKKS